MKAPIELHRVIEIYMEIERISTVLATIHCEVSAAYPLSRSERWRRRMERARDALLDARLELEELSIQQYGDGHMRESMRRARGFK
jgi:hypothetical protein